MLNKKMAFLIRSTAVLMSLGLLSFAMVSCEDPKGEPKPNVFPETRLSNVPPNDTIALYIRLGAIPEQTLYWIGDDEDGFVVAYRYRWTDIYNGTAAPVPWTTILNLTTLGGFNLDTLVLVKGTPSSWFRMYNFLATLDPDDVTTRERIRDSLATGRPFAVPYLTGFVQGDSIVGADPLKNEAPTKGVFLFDSPTDSNMHRFEVSSIDNSDVEDPTPAVTHFWTLKSPGPVSRITLPATGEPGGWVDPFFVGIPDGGYVLRYPTERNPGLTFILGAFDASTDQFEYSWSVDDTLHWSPFNPEPRANVSAIHFNNAASDTHKFFLRVINRWGVLSPVDSILRWPNFTAQTQSTAFIASVPPIDDPSWPKRTLIINNCRIVATFPSNLTPGPVDSSDVIAFYNEVMDSIGMTGMYDMWTVVGHSNRFPSRDVLAMYTSVLLLSEQRLGRFGPGSHKIVSSTKTNLEEYLDIGGKLIYSGSPDIVETFAQYDEWADERFHIVPTTVFPFTQNTQRDFIGAKGTLGYPDVRLDPAKFPTDSTAAIRNIAVNFPRGFGQTISFYDSKSDSMTLVRGFRVFENAPLGIRYLAPPAVPPARQTYSIVHFGFPLYYGRKSDVIASLRKAFQDIGEL